MLDYNQCERHVILANLWRFRSWCW